MRLIDFWQVFAGLGLFLYGMYHLENSIKQVEGRAFKLFLRKHTNTKLSAILSGTFITGILQSSSIVNLILLSFVGAGMISMRNALGVVVGANIGGTFNSWIVAFLGFRMDMGSYAFAIIGFAAIGIIAANQNTKFHQLFKFSMGVGLLFLGLDFIKIGMDVMIRQFDFTPYLAYDLWVFVIIGFTITVLVQTSAATVAIVLSALYAGIFPIETAVAVVLGAEFGTTMKVVIGAIGGIAAKKRVALANLIINFITSLFGFIFLGPLVVFIRDIAGISDPLFTLVAFQSLINILGAIFFYFFLGHFGSFLERTFKDRKVFLTNFLQNSSPQVSDTAIEMLDKEINLFLKIVLQLNTEVFAIDAVHFRKENNIRWPFAKGDSYDSKYARLKELEGEILSFYSTMGDENLQKDNLLRLNQLMSCLRNAMHSAKSMKDIVHDRRELSNSGNDHKYGMFVFFQSHLTEFYQTAATVFHLEGKEQKTSLEQLTEKTNLQYDATTKMAYEHASKKNLKEVDISTLFNINRELHASCHALILAMKDYFDNSPAD